MNKLIITTIFLSMVLVLALVVPGAAEAQYNYANCTYHAYRLCVGNTNLYWYDSCGNQQDLYLSCSNGQVCNNQSQYGQCAAYSIINPVLPPVQPVYIAHNTIACFSGSIHWFDTLGVESGLYKNCQDSNSCTKDSCSNNTCYNITKCDGSTCAIDSADYKTYCSANQPAAPVAQLSISFFTKQDSSSNQWQKTAQVQSDGNIYFMISVANNSTAQIDNVNVSANIPSEISSLGNLQLNNVPVSGDIVSGINIGSVTPQTSKSITFEGKAQTISSATTKQAIATTNISGQLGAPSVPDSISISFSPGQVNAPAAAVSSAPTSTGFWGFLKHWYLWIIVGLILIFLFVVVFKRFSSDV